MIILVYSPIHSLLVFPGFPRR